MRGLVVIGALLTIHTTALVDSVMADMAREDYHVREEEIRPQITWALRKKYLKRGGTPAEGFAGKYIEKATGGSRYIVHNASGQSTDITEEKAESLGAEWDRMVNDEYDDLTVEKRW